MNRLTLASALAAATLALAAPAFAVDKPWICHPVEGRGETGTGWNLINPAKASSHIDEATGAGKHTRKDGRTDVYAVNGLCPGTSTPSPTTTGGTPSPTTTRPNHSTTSPPSATSPTTSPSQSTTSSTSPPPHKPTVTTRPSGTPSVSSSTQPTRPLSSPSPASSLLSKATSTSPTSPLTSAPSSTDAPADRLARTGSALLPALALAGALLFLGIASLVFQTRRNGGGQG